VLGLWAIAAEADTKADNDIARRMIDKRIEQTPLVIEQHAVDS
jgi:hypothetical protein